uniref:Gem-associated protein 8 n=1 Tax=Parascaris univalens TaxID=6257 RepID=A0A915BNL4_PARUN
MANTKRHRRVVDEAWWYAPRFANFWARYEAAAAWTDIHRQAVCASYAAAFGTNKKEEDTVCTSTGEMIFRASDSDEWDLCTEEEDQSIDEEEEVEIDEEMAAFLRKTAEHRKQRDAERLKENNKKSDYWMEINGEDYILADKIGVEGASHRTTAMPNVGAEEQAKHELREKLYGKDANKIAAMEAALQIRYEQYIANTDAQMWPIIPLKI